MQYEQQALSNLANFGDQGLLSILDRLEIEPAAGSIVDREYCLAEVLESLLWLDLGVELEFFPVDRTQALFSSAVSPSLLRECDDFLDRWPSLFSSGDLSLFSGHLAEGIAFEQPSGRYPEPWMLQSAFQHMAFLGQRFAGNEKVRLLTIFLSFMDDDHWRSALTQSIDTSELGRFAEDRHPTGSKIDLLLAAVSVLEHIRTTGDYIAGLLLYSAYSDIDVQRLIRDVSRIQVWRLNLWLPKAEMRFSELLDELMLETSSRIRALVPGVTTQEAPPIWRAAMNSLTSSWKSRSFADQWPRDVALQHIRGSETI